LVRVHVADGRKDVVIFPDQDVEYDPETQGLMWNPTGRVSAVTKEEVLAMRGKGFAMDASTYKAVFGGAARWTDG
jgi:hypothetical protein